MDMDASELLAQTGAILNAQSREQAQETPKRRKKRQTISAKALERLAERRRPRAVNFWDRKDDHDCALYAAMGYSTLFIMERTGLTHCQVTYRLQKAGLTKANGASRLDFRNGKSPFSPIVLSAVRQAADNQLVKFLNAHV